MMDIEFLPGSEQGFWHVFVEDNEVGCVMWDKRLTQYIFNPEADLAFPAEDLLIILSFLTWETMKRLGEEAEK